MAYSYKSYSQTKDVMKKYVNATEGSIIYSLGKTRFMALASDVDVMCFVNGQFVPCIELYEAMDRALTLFEMFAAFGVKKK